MSASEVIRARKDPGYRAAMSLAAVLMILTVACSLAGLAQSGGTAQSSYTWQLNCSGATTGLGVSTGVNWVWLHNGVQISLTTPPNGFTSCATPPLSGSGLIPASINGIQVNGIEVDLTVSESPAGCDGFASVKKSFDPSNPKISIKESVSVPSGCPKAGFQFSLQ